MSDDVISTSKPYDAQRHKLEFGWNESKANYLNSQAAGPYQGGWYAGLNGQQNAAMGAFGNFLSGFSSPYGGGGQPQMMGAQGGSQPLSYGTGGSSAVYADPRMGGMGGSSQARPQGGGGGDFSEYATLPGRERGKAGNSRPVGPTPVMVGGRPQNTVRGYGTGAAAAPQGNTGVAGGSSQGALAALGEPRMSPSGASQPMAPQGASGASQGALAGATGQPTAQPQMAPQGASGGSTAPSMSASGASPQEALQNAAFANAGAGASYGSNANDIFNRYGGDATQGILSRVGQYASDPNLENAIGAAKSDIYRDLKENGLVANEMDAASSGNINSSRTGISDAVLKRGAMEQASQVDASMRESAYTRALGAAQQDYFGGASTALQANNQVGQSFQMGQQGMMGALGFGNAMYQSQMGMGNVQQQNSQNQLNANREKYEYLNGGYQNGILNQYLNQTGGAQWGNVQTGAQSGSGMSTALTAGGTLLGGAVGAYFGGPAGAQLGAAAGGAGGGALAGLFG